MPASRISSNSSRVVKWYSRPFSSEPLGGRVVHEIEKSTLLTCLRSSLTSVLFPDPDGAEIINKIPATLDASLPHLISYNSFHVLYLLASLFDLRLHRQAQFRDTRTFTTHPAGL